jgi:hypothetical protein
MKTRYVVLSGLIVLALLCTIGMAAAQADNTTDANAVVVSDDIQPYTGPFGPGNALYGLKIGMENLDEVFTFNETERMEKQLDHAMLRIAEVRRELELNRTDAADRALELYWQKMNLTETDLTPMVSNATGLLHAQEMITKHQIVLENLLVSHPDNPGLMRAYNNSLELEQKFEQKTAIRLDRIMDKDNRTILKAVRLELRKPEWTQEDHGERALSDIWNRTAFPAVTTRSTETQPPWSVNATLQREQDRNRTKYQGNATFVPTPVTTRHGENQHTPAVTEAPQHIQPPSNDQGNNYGKGNEDDNGHGGPHNK